MIYKAQLAKLELVRLRYNLEVFKRVLIAVEDKEFYQHHGVSYRGLVRMILSCVGIGRRSGGSTITQQLVRTLFIRDLDKTARRKLVEIFLALWFDRCFDKDSQLHLYAASVRFDRGVMGLPAATKHFTGKAVKFPKEELSFFMVERLSNIKASFLSAKIRATTSQLIRDRVLLCEHLETIIKIYREALRKGILQGVDERGIETSLTF